MAATTAYYQYIIDLYHSRTRFSAWDKRLENHRQWLHGKKTLSWPATYNTFG